jgi:hypothetical protein
LSPEVDHQHQIVASLAHRASFPAAGVQAMSLSGRLPPLSDVTHRS